MRRRLLAALGLVAIAGLTAPAYAQSRAAASSETDEDITLSGDSLEGIESRTISDDFDRFFLANSATISFSNGEATDDVVTEQSFRQEEGITYQLDEDTEIIVNQPLSPRLNPLSFDRNTGPDAIDRFKVQFELE
jgi:hypothetical protein